MAEVYTAPFSVTLSSAYTAGNSTISVSAVAPSAVQTGTFRVRLGNTANTVLKVTNAGTSTTWNVVAEFNDANAASGVAVYGCELSPGALDQIRADDGSGTVTSVALTTPSFLSVSGSPITSSGTLAVSAATGQAANKVLATPDGTTGSVSLRSLVAGDLPLATTGVFGAVKPDGTSITISGGVITSTVSGGMTNPMTTSGDVIYGGTSGTPTRLAGGTSGYVLTSNGPTNAPSWQVSSGGSGSAGWPSILFTTPPSSSSLTWANQGSATASDQGGGFLLSAPASSTDNIRSLTKSYPSSPFTFTVAFSINMRLTNFAHGGICITDGTKYITFGVGWNSPVSASSPTLGIYHWTNASTYSSTVYNAGVAQLPLYWLQIQDDGTNLYFRISFNGVDFTVGTMASESRTAFLTPTRIGAFMNPGNASYGMSGLFVSWSGV